jgi:hypothetical protein
MYDGHAVLWWPGAAEFHSGPAISRDAGGVPGNPLTSRTPADRAPDPAPVCRGTGSGRASLLGSLPVEITAGPTPPADRFHAVRPVSPTEFLNFFQSLTHAQGKEPPRKSADIFGTLFQKQLMSNV